MCLGDFLNQMMRYLQAKVMGNVYCQIMNGLLDQVMGEADEVMICVWETF
jgi:hypothetical protein